jgi:Ni,Fe-hydrogenase I small subunit
MRDQKGARIIRMPDRACIAPLGIEANAVKHVAQSCEALAVVAIAGSAARQAIIWLKGEICCGCLRSFSRRFTILSRAR